MGLKPALQETGVWAIPQNWTVVTIGELARFSSGQGISIATLQGRSAEHPVPVYGGNGIAGYTGRPTTQGPTVVIGRVGQRCGEVHLTDGPAWVTDNALFPVRVLRPLDVRFLALALGSARLNDVKNRNDLPLVTQSILHAVRIPWPPEMEEQRAIAAALSDVDTLIASLERLIVKKRELKQAAMEQLLTGQTRLPGFRGEWERVSLAERAILKARIGWQGLTTAEYLDSGDHFLVTGTDLLGGRVQWGSCHFVSEQRYVQDVNIQLRPRDVLLTKDGTIGKVAFVPSLPGKATLNSGVFVIRPKNDGYDPHYLYFVLKSRVFDDFLARLQAGSTISHLYQKDFVGFTFSAPARVDEQAAIAGALSDMDAELDALEARRDKTRLLKQGMMQELLTGRTRLV
jgi:type I restriction enzyme, S subunit